MSKQIQLTAPEFAQIADDLKSAPVEEGISIAPKSGTQGTISGIHPVDWTADYAYANGSLTVHGHGIFGGRVENGICDRLTVALDDIRAKGSV